MNDNHLIQWLKQADAASDFSPPPPARLAVAARRKFRHRRQMHRAALAAAAMTLILTGVAAQQRYQSDQKDRQVAQMQQEIQQLTQQTEATLKLVDEVLTQQKQQNKLTALNRQLAQYTAADNLDAEGDETACLLVYQADKMYNNWNMQSDAIENYQRVIDCFPKTPWAETARRRLDQIQQTQTDQI